MGGDWTDNSLSLICRHVYIFSGIAIFRKIGLEQMRHRCRLVTSCRRAADRQWGHHRSQGLLKYPWCLRQQLKFGLLSFSGWISIIYINLLLRNMTWFSWARHIRASGTRACHGQKTSSRRHILPSIWQRLEVRSWKALPYASSGSSCSQRYPHLERDNSNPERSPG